MSSNLEVDIEPIEGEPILGETVAFAETVNQLLREGKIDAREREDGQIGLWARD